ncbi:ABC transporter permease [Bacteroidia bacterium]|nr:ABC transporter permease [Bacteroidia bacterium]
MKTLQNFLFVLQRFKTSSILNIVGLSVAFAVFSVITIQTYYDFSYDRNIKKAKHIYFYSNYYLSDGRYNFWTSTGNAKYMADKFPEIQNYCALSSVSNKLFDTDDGAGNKRQYKAYSTLSTGGFLDLFTPDILEGDARQAFTEPGKAMITQSAAKTMFDNRNPIGQKIYYHNSDKSVTVVAVCRDFPENSTLKNGIYTILIDDNPSSWNYSVYFEIDPQQVASCIDKMNTFDEETLRFLEEQPENRMEARLTPLSKRHLYFPEYGSGNITTTLSLLALGILTLAIALINFVNFSVAMAPSRVRSLNIQKILGSGTRRLRFVIAGEAVLFAGIAFLIALFLIVLFQSGTLSKFISADLSLTNNTGILIGIGAGLSVIAFLSGIYPAHYVTSFQPAMALSGSFAVSKKSSGLRNVLTVIQFCAAIILIVTAGFIKIQHDYLVNYSWGYQKENIVYVSATDLKSNESILPFGEELKKQAGITDYAISGFVPGSIQMGWTRDFLNKQIYIYSWPVGDDFLRFFGVPVVVGRDFSSTEDARPQLVVNEKFLHKYDFTAEEVLGQEIFCFDTTGVVVGIAKDVNFSSLKTPIEPMTFVSFGNDAALRAYYNHYLFIKIAGGNPAQTVESVGKIWLKFSDEPFNPIFLDAELNNLYQNETDLAKFITLVGLLAIIIAVMGVYGLIVFNAKYKQKEIAIRKVNGSTIKEIIWLLNWNVLIQLGVAFVLAVPVAYIIVHRWLENFAYKTPVYWWVFLLGGIIILLITVITVSAQSYKAAKRNPTWALNSD